MDGLCVLNTITEGEPLFSEWLKQCEIKTFEHIHYIEDFFNDNNDLVTSLKPANDSTVDAILQKEDSDECTGETVSHVLYNHLF